jgi:hypothetical protein
MNETNKEWAEKEWEDFIKKLDKSHEEYKKSDDYKADVNRKENFITNKENKYSLKKLDVPCKKCLVVAMCDQKQMMSCDKLKRKLKIVIKDIKKKEK